MPNLLRSQVFQIHEKINEKGLSLADFRWEPSLPKNEIYAELPLKLIHSLGMYFEFLSDDELPLEVPTYQITYFPDNRGDVTTEFFHQYDSVCNTFDKWLSVVCAQVQFPNWWPNNSHDGNLLEAAGKSKSSDEQFTEDELLQIKIGIQEIKNFLLDKSQCDDNQINLINEKLDLLEEEAQNSKKSAWMHTAIGVLASIAFALSLDSETGRALFSFAGKVFNKILLLPLP